MKIIELRTEHVKRLKAVRIVPEGSVVTITGDNEQGKSSVIDSIVYAFSGKGSLPPTPVRRGEESATILVDLGDMVVKRVILATGETNVTVESKDGARYPSPQSVLDGLRGKLMDPLQFWQADAKTQLDILKKLVPLDVDIDALDRLNLRDYSDRTETNRRGRSLVERVATLKGGVKEMDVTPIDIKALTAEMTAAFESNAAASRIAVNRREAAGRTTQLRSEVQGLTQDIERLQHQLTLKRGALDAAVEAEYALPPVPDAVDTEPLRQQIIEATRENGYREEQIRARATLAGAEIELQNARDYSAVLTDRMEARQKEKEDAIARAKMPIEGLSFGDGQVLFDKLPFEQASSAQRIRVAMAIARATNPTLKVILIRDASLLGPTNLALVATEAAEWGYQVWLEKVGSPDAKVGIVIEDGEVVAIDGVPAIAEAETE